MKYASLTKLGGELIEADRADYDDYKGFLRCPECGEPVFLRKSHTRQSAQRVSAVGGTAIAVPSQLITVPSAFVHHQAVPEVSVCELRVGGYTEAEVEYRRSVSRDQRLRKLQVSMWKYLKSNRTILRLEHYSSALSNIKKNINYLELVQWLKNQLDSVEMQEAIINHCFPEALVMFQDAQFRTNISTDIVGQKLCDFLGKRKRDWLLHCKIAEEALTLVIKSQAMRDIRNRLIICILNPLRPCRIGRIVQKMAGGGRDEVLFEQSKYLLLSISVEIAAVFLSVDWVQIFEDMPK